MNAVTRLSTGLTQPSPLFFGYGIESQFSQYLDEALGDQPADKIFFVADEGVPAAHELGRSLCAERSNVELMRIAPGEATKSWAGLESLCEQFVAKGASKRSVAIACGGGSIGNLVGMAAALLFRGIRYVEMPTSFMHLTDGVLSNKQAINGRQGKNHFGLYHAPLFVWADARYLETEPVRSRKAGMAEAIKNAFISQPDLIPFFRSLLRPDGRLSSVDLEQLALNTILSKLEILRRDPTEKHYALVLEYGHTFGHAIEWLSHGTLLHGECVAVGMKMAAHLANELGFIADGLVDLHYELIDACLGLVPKLPAHIDAASLFATMKCDNKKTGDSLRFVLLKRLGSCANYEGDYLVTVRDNAYVLNFVERFLSAYPRRLDKRPRSAGRANAGRLHQGWELAGSMAAAWSR
ncbi:MAG TPA: 2-deoxy-scyllo-inosose synthase [Burkholderiaceae bacterium]|nr:2-deoxy-scyllo-inosose synthase [Burkholderiaceae bacterium]